MRQMTLQNRIALDMILLEQEGICALICQQCCVFINDTSSEVLTRVNHLEQIAEDLENSIHPETPSWIRKIKDAVKSWFSWIPNTWSWVKNVIKTVIYVVVVAIALSILVKCLLCLRTLCKLCNCCQYKVGAGEKLELQQY